MIVCGVRRGRPPEQRAELAQALIDACVETLACFMHEGCRGGLRRDEIVAMVLMAA
jgi:hypothetical protein